MPPLYAARKLKQPPHTTYYIDGGIVSNAGCANQNVKSYHKATTLKRRPLHGCANRNTCRQKTIKSPVGRTSHGCVNQNDNHTMSSASARPLPARVRESKRTNLHTGKDAPGRTLRGHANQNNAFFFLAAAGIRRTHAGARIETWFKPHSCGLLIVAGNLHALS